ncbi:hypothetical protein Y032_0200g1685 [Ancylostoma ceylanicum]|uniref:Uncharacterized protein n=1 Tax=Ancylostoma ceylanicum TaxID=53326 RepID=A0A016SNL3_9BILA|nr:hypothetical protein Y032_0200g1685 [Ancylostoma ceylanicum]
MRALLFMSHYRLIKFYSNFVASTAKREPGVCSIGKMGGATGVRLVHSNTSHNLQLPCRPLFATNYTIRQQI